jgi:hypothetical protein
VGNGAAQSGAYWSAIALPVRDVALE